MGSITACFVATAALVSSKEASGRESLTRASVRFIGKYAKALFLSPFGWLSDLRTYFFGNVMSMSLATVA